MFTMFRFAKNLLHFAKTKNMTPEERREYEEELINRKRGTKFFSGFAVIIAIFTLAHAITKNLTGMDYKVLTTMLGMSLAAFMYIGAKWWDEASKDKKNKKHFSWMVTAVVIAIFGTIIF